MNKQQLASKIWESANKMRSKIEANEYKDYILGFIFYKFLSEREEKYVISQINKKQQVQSLTSENEKLVKEIQTKLGYFISYDNLFSTWIRKGKNFTILDVKNALDAFNIYINPDNKKVFEGIFDTLKAGLSKLGENASVQTKAASDLITLIDTIPMDNKQDYDVLGFIYEYLISMFAENAGKKAGEFYTPHEVSVVISEIVAHHLKDKKKISIYDPTSGSGSLLINIGKAASKYIKNPDNITYYAQELKQNTYNLTRMNLVMRGISPANIITRNGDTLEEDWPYFDEKTAYYPVILNAVVSNPPYSLHWDPDNKGNEPRYIEYDLAPKAKADYAFLLHDLYHIEEDGIGIIILPHGVLFRGGVEEKIRKQLVDNNKIDCIIGLPANIFFGTGIPTIIMVLKKKRKNTDIQLIDASKGFRKDGKNNRLRACDIKKIIDTVIQRKNVEKYARIIEKKEIEENDYNLNIARYIDSSEESETWDVYASVQGGIPSKEIERFNSYWKRLPNLRKGLFKKESIQYSKLKVENVKEFIRDHFDIKKYSDEFRGSFKDFEQYLTEELIQNIEKIDLSEEENIISDEIFKRMENHTLIDKYQAYQILDEEWEKISEDLETLQLEGFQASKQVDPRMVVKKKKGKEEEVREGWVGHIIPFELVQETFFKEELTELRQKENRWVEIIMECEQLLERALEDENAIKQYAGLKKEEKMLKNDIRTKSEKLHNATKKKIENLTEEEVQELLKIKWIHPLMNRIYKLPEQLIYEFSKKIQALADKYSITYLELDTQIKETEEELISFLEELEANDFDKKGLEELKMLLRGDGQHAKE